MSLEDTIIARLEEFNERLKRIEELLTPTYQTLPIPWRDVMMECEPPETECDTKRKPAIAQRPTGERLLGQ